MDDCHRVAVLRSVGYRVDECASLVQLATALERANGADAVFLTESDNISSEKAISLARERSTAPVVLFSRSAQGEEEYEFDLVIPPLTSPEKWLREVGSLLEWSQVVRDQARAITKQARTLRRETSALRMDSLRERERSVRERTRNSGADASDPWQTPGGSN
jgi:hypothetical protein